MSSRSRLAATVFSLRERLTDIVAMVRGIPPVRWPRYEPPADPVRGALGQQAELERALRDNVLAFWLPRCVDDEHGGYATGFDRAGRPTRQTSKGALPQCRMAWLFARAYGQRHAGPACLDAAGHGIRFVTERLWDDRFGGFVWEVDARGERIIRGKKHLVAQTYALFALSEYYLVTNDREVLAFARRLFDLLEAKAHDDRWGGYLEFFEADWTPAPPQEIGYLNEPAAAKLVNSHLHVLEAYTTFYRADPERRDHVGKRLREVLRLLTDAAVRKEFGVCTDRFEHDWRPRSGGAADRVSYGHNLESISMQSDACAVLGEANPVSLYESMFDYSLRYGYDATRGAFFESGRLGRPADWRDLIWWVQAEALWSSIRMFELTRQARYLDVFGRLWEFIRSAQIDWTHGEWHLRVRRNGRAAGDKATIWKCGYHNGRALMEAISALRRLQPSAPVG
ncbi:MAG TPA: AGE family epimerase/isomerase [Methylomirabilota bacterium]|nr:AGE family epimerase/isomerase [Methylomirabilota bacterium]